MDSLARWVDGYTQAHEGAVEPNTGRRLREHEPALAAPTAAIRVPHDYLTERLTGEAVTDRGDASGIGSCSTAKGGYDPRILPLVAAQFQGTN
jgi:sugar (pentulose or hexulose) kinase